MHIYIISLLKRGVLEVVFIGPNGPWILNTTVYHLVDRYRQVYHSVHSI